jgi:signal peptidase I
MNDVHDIKCELARDVLRSSGKLRLQVAGWSMLPSIWPGDTVIIEGANASSVSEGDVVLFGREKRLFVHRVIRKVAEKSVLLTQGDAMNIPDSPVDENEFLGRVTFIVRNGRLLRPRTKLRIRDRAIATLVRHSETGARAVVVAHGFVHN